MENYNQRYADANAERTNRSTINKDRSDRPNKSRSSRTKSRSKRDKTSKSTKPAKPAKHAKPAKPVKKVKMYNSSKLHIGKHNTLVICDWDDTFFPTTWVNEQGIDLSDMRSRYTYVRYFDALDKYLSDTIKQILEHGDLMIITNATLQWIDLTLTVLPKTKTRLSSIPIVSAREAYQTRCDMSDWKKHTFKAELLKLKHKMYRNIVSIGDAHYEHQALVDLYRWTAIPHKYLKSVKFTKSSDCIDLFNQVKLIGDEIPNITRAQRHLDLSLDIV